MGYRDYLLVLRLEGIEIVGSIENQSVPLAEMSAPRQFKIESEFTRPVIGEGGVE